MKQNSPAGNLVRQFQKFRRGTNCNTSVGSLDLKFGFECDAHHGGNSGRKLALEIYDHSTPTPLRSTKYVEWLPLGESLPIVWGEEIHHHFDIQIESFMPEVEIPQSWREIGSYMMYEDLSAYPSLEACIMHVLDSWFSEGERQCVLAFLILLGKRNLTPEEMAAVWNAAEIPVVVMSSTGVVTDHLAQRMVTLIGLAGLQRE